jgi:hypothetical protein
MTLSIAANALSPGRTYTFKLSVWARDAPEAVGYSRVSFIVAQSPPTGGNCTCTPAEGDAGTEFSLVCSNWQAGSVLGSLSLLYSFSALLPSGIVMPLSVARSAQPSLITQLPASGANSSNVILATICDPSSVCTTVDLSVRVLPVMLVAAQAQSLINRIIEYSDTAALLTAAAVYSSAEGNSSDKLLVSSSLLNAVQKVGNSSALDPSDQVGMLAQQNGLSQTVMFVVGDPSAVVSKDSVLAAQNFVASRANDIAQILRGQSALSVAYDASQLAQQVLVSVIYYLKW